MSLSRRLAALESRRHGSLLPPIGAGPIGITGMDGQTVIAWCFDGEQPRLAGLPDMRSKARWRDRQTCPDADTCPNAGDCIADGSGPAGDPSGSRSD